MLIAFWTQRCWKLRNVYVRLYLSNKHMNMLWCLSVFKEHLNVLQETIQPLPLLMISLYNSYCLMDAIQSSILEMTEPFENWNKSSTGAL